jgi:hypothetical protein
MLNKLLKLILQEKPDDFCEKKEPNGLNCEGKEIKKIGNWKAGNLLDALVGNVHKSI